MKKNLPLLVFLLSIPFLGVSQHWSFGVFAGGSNYNGELTAAQPVFIQETHPSFGILGRYSFSPYVTAKGSLTYGRISGDDENNSAPSRVNGRNLSFRSDIFEASLQAEINIFGFDPTDNDHHFAIYLLGGVSVYNFNPQSKYQGEWYDLQKLGTEGQGSDRFPNREKYSLTQVSFPLGGGLKYAFNHNWSLGIEFGARKTLTDYLDDVSRTYAPKSVFEGPDDPAYRLSNRTWETFDEAKDYGANKRRGNPETADWYMFGGLTLTYTIAGPHCQGF